MVQMLFLPSLAALVCMMLAKAMALAPAKVGVGLCRHATLEIRSTSEGPPRQDIAVEDVTEAVADFVRSSGVEEGVVTVCSKHTTTGVTINEWEKRLVTDLREWLLGLAPPDARSVAAGDARYAHNDIDARPDGDAERERCFENGWNVDDPDVLQAWRDQEPINAHSHLLAMLLGATESIPVSEGKLMLGQWQSILLVDLDGPRDRQLLVSAMGFGQPQAS